MEWIDAKQLLMKAKQPSEWFGFEYVLNLYKGCCHGCIYCDSRSNCYRIENFDQIRAKKNSTALLMSELKNKKKKGIIGMGAMSDPYNPFEKNEKITRNALKVILANGFGVGICTKSELVMRDLDLLSEIHSRKRAVVNITITCAEDDLSKMIEPNVAPSSKRFEAVAACKKAGIICGILMNPVLPFITDTKENIRSVIEKAHACHADYIYTYMSVTLRQNQRVYYYEKLDELFPGLSYQYKRIYGNRYHCESLKWRENYEFFKQECEKRGILYRMEDIICLIEKENQKVEQMSFFM